MMAKCFRCNKNKSGTMPWTGGKAICHSCFGQKTDDRPRPQTRRNHYVQSDAQLAMGIRKQEAANNAVNQAELLRLDAAAARRQQQAQNAESIRLQKQANRETDLKAKAKLENQSKTEQQKAEKNSIFAVQSDKQAKAVLNQAHDTQNKIEAQFYKDKEEATCRAREETNRKSNPTAYREREAEEKARSRRVNCIECKSLDGGLCKKHNTLRLLETDEAHTDLERTILSTYKSMAALAKHRLHMDISLVDVMENIEARGCRPPLAGELRPSKEKDISWDTYTPTNIHSTSGLTERKRNTPTDRSGNCIICGSKECGDGWPPCWEQYDNPVMHHIEEQIREVEHAEFYGRKIDLVTAYNGHTGWTFRRCPFSQVGRGGMCECLLPVSAAQQNAGPAAVEPEIKRYDRKEQAWEALETYNPSLALTALDIMEQILLIFTVGAETLKDDDTFERLKNLSMVFKALEDLPEALNHLENGTNLTESNLNVLENMIELVTLPTTAKLPDVMHITRTLQELNTPLKDNTTNATKMTDCFVNELTNRRRLFCVQLREAASEKNLKMKAHEIISGFVPENTADIIKARRKDYGWRHCYITETSSDALMDLVRYLWMMLDGETLATVTKEKKRVYTTNRMNTWRVIRDRLLIKRVLPCLYQAENPKRMSIILANQVHDLTVKKTSSVDLDTFLNRHAISLRNFNKVCVLAHAWRLSTLLSAQPGKKLLGSDYDDFYRTARDELDKIIQEQHAPYAFPVNRAVGKNLKLPGGATDECGLVADVEATLNLGVSPNSDWGGGTSFNYISFLFGEGNSIGKSTTKLPDPNHQGTTMDVRSSSGAHGHLTASALATQSQLLISFAQIGHLLVTRDWEKLKTKEIIEGAWGWVGNTYQATSGLIATIADACPTVAHSVGCGSIGVGLINSTIHLFKESEKAYTLRKGNNNIKSRIELLESLQEETVKNGLEDLANFQDRMRRADGATPFEQIPKHVDALVSAPQTYGGLQLKKSAVETLTNGCVRQGFGLSSAVLGFGSSVFTLVIAAKTVSSTGGLTSAMIIGGTIGMAVPIVGWCLVGVAVITGLALLAYDTYQRSQAGKRMMELGLNIAAQNDDEANMAEACVLLHAAALLTPRSLNTNANKTIVALQALNWAFFTDIDFGTTKPVDEASQWCEANKFAFHAGPEGIYNTLQVIRKAS